ncbi:glycosyltransferase family 4 protein [Psychroflexus sp. YR1-1]|uniref:Glycosyltransferase family 4 protein n=1 Tax=Psychroflexus aurantiacus TaxID=2709310 RepID=A0A6B3R4H7_9FLAO|nr:glycosyltransferase family 4 protein [Psychroflexus aurantiacus]NEV94057.1 glycosyltransferase family 4 protein [Psychroflexus aurantiacus]
MKKVLIITYYWPPAGGPGVQRWLQFSKHLPEFGIQPIVYKPQNPSYPIKDSSLRSSPEVKVIEKSIFEPYAFAELLSKSNSKTISSGIIKSRKKQSWKERMMLYVRGNFFIPDARVLWVKPSISFLIDYIKHNEIETIITTGPPHSLHLIGLGLKNSYPDLHWIADFRDPWTTIGYHSALKLTEKSKQKHLALEKDVLNSADQLITTSFQTRAEFENKTKTPIEVITNGYEDITAEAELSENFTVSHIGSLLNDRNPKVLWEVLGELIDENLVFKDFFELKLIGKISDTVLESARSYGLKNYISVAGYLNHKDAIESQRSSQMLLLIEIDKPETRGIIPGKLFEYLASHRPILAIGPEGWDVSKIIAETDSGDCFTYEEKTRLKSYIEKAFKAFLNGKLKGNTKNIEHYSRRNLTQKLTQLIK